MYRRKNFYVVLFVLFVGCFTLVGCKLSGESQPAEINVSTPVENESQASSGPPPLVVDTSEPLLLDDPAKDQATATEAATRNKACFVCHANYMGEFLVERHAKGNIGCVNCHGDSLAHRNDENNTTPPDTMYATEGIDPFCRGCHGTHNVPPEKVVARWIERGLNKDDAARIVCTDCHGEHRMKVRTVIWDKKTGKLLRTNKGD